MKHYKIKKEENRLWLIEDSYAPLYELKTESIFAQCNGYMGVRATHPFLSIEENRGMFLCGAFDKAYEGEVTELVNCPDLTWFGIEVDSEKLHTDSTKMLSCVRKIDILSGELFITYVFRLLSGVEIEIEVKRFASLDNKNVFSQSYRVRLRKGTCREIKITTGINGQITNSGVSHFHEMTERVYDRKVLESRGVLKDNAVIVLTECLVRHGYLKKTDFTLKRRSIYGIYTFDGNTEIQLDKISYVYQTEEKEETRIQTLENKIFESGYEQLFQKHLESMLRFWEKAEIRIDGISLKEETAIRFAQYHILGMTPPEQSRYSIAAKGLTGEGYKGHVFWDTEIFVFPFLLFHYPEKARELLIFRYKGLDGAHKKAKTYGYEGAMFPWEAAKTGEEETPEYAALNIHTGKANKVWSGIKEYHVTADIIYAVEQYYQITNDKKFMNRYGYEMIFEAAKFWVSCAKWNESKKKFVICDVIGPDEYTEHVDNNAYTNYMAEFCVRTAYDYVKKLSKENPEYLEQINLKTNILGKMNEFEKFLEKIYLPKPNAEGIIPQDDTFLSKPCLPQIEKYKTSQVKQSVLMDYSRDEVVNMQVLKQADVVMLLNMFPKLFTKEVVRKNVLFYEERTIHDSSLSYCAHAQASAGINDGNSAESFFEKALYIDLNDNPYDSGDGIHSASLGGIWNCLIYGFAGIEFTGENLFIHPCMPKTWEKMEFNLMIRQTEIHFSISEKTIIMESNRSMKIPLCVWTNDKKYEFINYLKINREE